MEKKTSFEEPKNQFFRIVHIPDDVVVDSVVTVIDEFDNKCWLIALIVFVMEDALLPILLNDIDDGFCVEAELAFGVVELFAVLIFVPLLALSLFSPLALLLFRDARLLARADIRRFKSSRRSDLSGDTCDKQSNVFVWSNDWYSCEWIEKTPKARENMKFTLIREVKLDEDGALDSTEFVAMEFIFCIDDVDDDDDDDC